MDAVVPEDVLIDKVEIFSDSILGKGSYGVVFLAVYYGAPVAVKRLHRIFFEYDVQEEGIRGILHSFSMEWSLLKTLKHPNIVEFFGVYCPPISGSKGSTVGEYYIVCELLVMSLQERIDKGPKLSFRQVVDISKQIACGLRYLHERTPPIMHRDLASKNVLLSTGGEAKIADLGVAKVLSREKLQQNTRQPGTDSYMPVEVRLAESDYNESIDIFALGVIMLEMTIGHNSLALEPFTMTGGSLQIIPERQRRVRDFKDLLANDKNFLLEKVISKCLEERYSRPKAKDVWKAMDKLCDSEFYTECKPVPAIPPIPEDLNPQPVTEAQSSSDPSENMPPAEIIADLEERLGAMEVETACLQKEKKSCLQSLTMSQQQSELTMQAKEKEIAELRSINETISRQLKSSEYNRAQDLELQKSLESTIASLRHQIFALQDSLQRNDSQVKASQSYMGQRNEELEAEVRALRERLSSFQLRTQPSASTRVRSVPTVSYNPESLGSNASGSMLVASSISNPPRSRIRRDEMVSGSLSSKLPFNTSQGATMVAPPLPTPIYDRHDLFGRPSQFSDFSISSMQPQRQSLHGESLAMSNQDTELDIIIPRRFVSPEENPRDVSLDDLENERVLKTELKSFKSSIASLTRVDSDPNLIDIARTIKMKGDKLTQFLRRFNATKQPSARDPIDNEDVSTFYLLLKDCDKALHTVSSILRCGVHNDVMLLKAAKQLLQSGSVLLANLDQ